ncbi:hypothetical protein VTN77DRAFT_6385 [Rasamsonia byssochlamydoides]|uniref:uncharacterized protein n=1 Tax=Rasamsonia byssochlamydoides TaxID=89139 RepID=UPI00374368D1
MGDFTTMAAKSPQSGEQGGFSNPGSRPAHSETGEHSLGYKNIPSWHGLSFDKRRGRSLKAPKTVRRIVGHRYPSSQRKRIAEGLGKY